MFDINSRMQMWDSARNATYAEESYAIIRSADEQGADPRTRIRMRAAPFMRSKSTKIDFESRMNAWARCDKAMDSDIHANLSSTNPFKRSEEPSELQMRIAELPPEDVIAFIEDCINELESRGGAEKVPEAKEESKEDESEKKDAPEESEDAKDSKDEESEEDSDDKKAPPFE